MRHLASLIPFIAVGLAHAQTTATVMTTANGGAAASIMPGQTIAVAVSISHNAVYFAGIAGGTVVTGDAGSPSNFSTTIPSLPTVNLGAFVGGSRVGAEIAEIPPGVLGGTVPFSSNPMPVWQYSLRLDTPGIYTINWVPTASMPNVRLYKTFASFSYTEAQTTYTGATITVLPTPASLAVLAALPILTSRRRRTPGGAR